MDPTAIDILNTGGVLVFAFVIWRSLEKLKDGMAAERKADRDELAVELKEQTALLLRIVERMARIDDRTFRADTAAEGVPVVDPHSKLRRRTPPPTPFMDTEVTPNPRGRKP